MNTPRFAAIDIGSNTFRLLIAEKDSSLNPITPWKIIAYSHHIVRLGEGLHESEKLCDAAMQRALLAFHDFAKLLTQHHINSSGQYMAVATAAMREARNGQSFCQQVFEQTNIHIQIIDGNDEARMSLAGSCAVLPASKRDDMLLFDIGGGSTEFTRAKNNQCMDSISRKLGVVRLVEAHLHSNPPSPDDYAAIKRTCHTHLDAVEKHWQQQSSNNTTPPKHMIGTAGTVTTLAAIDLNMSDYKVELINNHSISKQHFFTLRDKLLSLTLAQRQAIPAIEHGRADLMIAGLAIIECIFERWHYEEMVVVDAGLLEGVWLNLSKN